MTPIPDFGVLEFESSYATLRWAGYVGQKTCSLTGGCIEKCLKGGLGVFDPPTLDLAALGMPNTTINGATPPVGAIRRQASTSPALPAVSAPVMPANGGLGIFVIPILDTPADNVACACEPVMGSLDASNTTFGGRYGELDLTLGLVKRNDTNISDLVLGIEDCLYYYAVEVNQDRNSDGVPDFLGAGVTDSISTATTAAVSGAIAGAVAGAVAASVAAAVGSAVTSAIGGAVGAGVSGGGAGGAAAGAAGGALTPLIMQAQFLGIAGQIGGKNTLPTSATGLSGGLSWTNFHLPFQLYGKPKKPGSRRKLLAHRRQATNATAVDKCAIIQQSESELGGTVIALVMGIGSAVGTRLFTRYQEIFNQDDDHLAKMGGMTISQFLGFSWTPLATEATVFGAAEFPVITKAYQGIASSGSEAVNSGCWQYELAGGVTLFVLLLFVMFICYIINKAVKDGLITFRWSNVATKAPTGMPLYQALSEQDKRAQEEAAQATPMDKQAGVQVTGASFGVDSPFALEEGVMVCGANMGPQDAAKAQQYLQKGVDGINKASDNFDAMDAQLQATKDALQAKKDALDPTKNATVIAAQKAADDAKKKAQETQGYAMFVLKILTSPILIPGYILTWVKKTMCELFTGPYKAWGEWNRDDPKNATVESKVFYGAYNEFFKDHQGRAYLYSIWAVLNVIIRAILIKTVTNQMTNANLILALEATDTVITFFSIPHINKEAFFDSMWGRISNLIQIAGISVYVRSISIIPSEPDPTKVGISTAGDSLAQLFMIMTIVGITPGIIGALKEAMEGIAGVYKQIQDMKEYAQSKLDAVKEKYDMAEEKYGQLKDAKDMAVKGLNFTQKWAIVFGPLISGALAERRRTDANYVAAVRKHFCRTDVMEEFELIGEKAEDDVQDAKPAPAPMIYLQYGGMNGHFIYGDGPGSGPFGPFPSNAQPLLEPRFEPYGFGMGGMPGMAPGMPTMGGPQTTSGPPLMADFRY